VQGMSIRKGWTTSLWPLPSSTPSDPKALGATFRTILLVDIGIYESPIFCAIQTSLDPLATKRMFDGIALFVHRQGIIVQETGLAGVGLFGEDHANIDSFRFVLQHLDQTGMRDLDKVLIGAFAQIAFLFEAIVFVDDESANCRFKKPPV
jgi:hypothetical protein